MMRIWRAKFRHIFIKYWNFRTCNVGILYEAFRLFLPNMGIILSKDSGFASVTALTGPREFSGHAQQKICFPERREHNGWESAIWIEKLLIFIHLHHGKLSYTAILHVTNVFILSTSPSRRTRGTQHDSSVRNRVDPLITSHNDLPQDV